MKTKTTKKLQLAKETIIHLNRTEGKKIIGGRMALGNGGDGETGASTSNYYCTDCCGGRR